MKTVLLFTQSIWLLSAIIYAITAADSNVSNAAYYSRLGLLLFVTTAIQAAVHAVHNNPRTRTIEPIWHSTTYLFALLAYGIAGASVLIISAIAKAGFLPLRIWLFLAIALGIYGWIIYFKHTAASWKFFMEQRRLTQGL